MSGNPEYQSISPVATGIVGLDDILGVGLAANRLYLVEGDPGSGKTTLALQYLLTGVAKGEKTLCVTLSETREELESVGIPPEKLPSMFALHPGRPLPGSHRGRPGDRTDPGEEARRTSRRKRHGKEPRP